MHILHNVLHSVGNIYWWTFLRGLILLLSQQIIPAVAKESLISNNATPDWMKQVQNTAQFFEQKVLFHTNINNKNTCKIVCKMQCLKNSL